MEYVALVLALAVGFLFAALKTSFCVISDLKHEINDLQFKVAKYKEFIDNDSEEWNRRVEELNSELE